MSKNFKLLNTQVTVVIESAIIAAESDAEICGLLVDNGYFIELIQVKNKSKKIGSFSFYMNEINFIEKAVRYMKHEIIGTFHSHPFSTYYPSKSDILNTYDDSFMLIIDVTRKSLGFWYIKDNGSKKVKFDIIE